MDKFRFLVQLPFLAQLLMPLAAMGLPVYQICRREVGTLRIDAHRIKPSAWRSAFRAQVAAWRALFARLMPMAAALILMIAIAHVLPDQADAFAGGALLIGQATDIRQLKQTKADKDAKLAALAVEMQGLLAVAFDKRDDTQKARITAIEAERATITTELAALTAEIALQERYLKAHTGGPSVQVGQNRAEQAPWVPEAAAAAAAATDASPLVRAEVRHMALGNFALAVRAASLGHGTDPRLMAAATGGGTQSDSNLGFAVPNEVAPGIEREMYENGELLSRCDVRTISGNSITYNRFDETSRADGSRQGGVLGYWVDEGTAPTASNMKLDKLELKLRKVGALGVLTDEILGDAIAMGGELEQCFGVELVFQTENRVYRGDGANCPQGFLNANCLVSVTKESGQGAGTIKTKNLSKMWARMPARSQKNAVWFINVDCGPQLDELAIEAGTAALEPRFVRYNDQGLMTIKGRPVIPVEYAESVGTQGDIALVDLKRYRLIRKGGIEQASSIHVYFAQGEQAFRAFYRVDGKAVPKAAITPFKGSGTLSPFVVLDTRA